MHILSLDKDDYWKVIIEWKPSCKWSKEDQCVNLKHKKEYGIYRFERRHGNQNKVRENLYIGHAFNQMFDNRHYIKVFTKTRLKKQAQVKFGSLWELLI